MNDIKDKNKTVTLKKELKERKISASHMKNNYDMDFQKTMNLLQNYYIPREEVIETGGLLKLVSCINTKVNSYKKQDLDKNKYNEAEFITVEDIIGKLIGCNLDCYYCKNKTEVFYTHSRQPNQWTLERIDNSIGHTNSNTVISCLSCNLQRRDKSSNAFKFAKQLVIKKV